MCLAEGEVASLKCTPSVERRELTEWLCYLEASTSVRSVPVFTGTGNTAGLDTVLFVDFWQANPVTNTKCSFIVQLTSACLRTKVK